MKKPKIVSQHMRGDIYINELGEPINVKRVYFIDNVPATVIRGLHANKHSNQLLICVSGSVSIKYDDGTKNGKCYLGKGECFYLPKLTYIEMDFSGTDAILMVLADHKYDKNEYIDGYTEFKEYIDNKTPVEH